MFKRFQSFHIKQFQKHTHCNIQKLIMSIDQCIE